MKCEQLRTFRESRSWETDPDWRDTEELKRRIRDHVGTPPSVGLSAPLFDEIIIWKLRNQRGRTEKHRSELTPEIIRAVTSCAFSMQHPEPMFNAKVRAGLLACLPGVGLGVASAILALTFPEEYGVIDFRVWKVIFNEDRRQFVMSDYTRYLERIRDCAHRVGWQAQQVDFFSWKYYETLPA